MYKHVRSLVVCHLCVCTRALGQDEDAGESLLRPSVALAVVDVLECYHVDALNALAATVRNRIATAESTHGKSAWKVIEAAVL